MHLQAVATQGIQQLILCVKRFKGGPPLKPLATFIQEG